MILSVFVAVSAIGFVLFAGGYLLDYTGIAAIGATIFLGVGAGVVLGGLEYQTGEVRTETSTNETVVEHQYTSVETPTRLPMGILLMLVAGLGYVRLLDDKVT
jgi:hypothetical protein